MVIAAASSISLGPFNGHGCYTDELCCSIPFKASSFGCKTSFLRSASHGSSPGHDRGLTKVSVAADYSDSVPDSSDYVSRGGYHPLEDVKVLKGVRETKLTTAEIARTTVEGNGSALLVFPGTIHCEPHDQITWTEVKYVIDDYGDIYFEIFDDENILQDPGASNPVKAFIGMDIPLKEDTRILGEFKISDVGNLDDLHLDEHFFEIMDPEIYDIPVDWGMPKSSHGLHPIYFAKCLTKAVSTDYDQKMDHPSNGVSILGCLRPAFIDEESYLRRLFYSEDRDDYGLEWQDGDTSSNRFGRDGSMVNSTLYRLEIVEIELFSIYGVQSSISLPDFQDAEPDVLAHFTSAIVDRFSHRGINSNGALKAFCKKKGLHVEGANLIGVDSLGMDVRVSTGSEVQTHRFPFKARATTEFAAEKQIQQLLFPRSRRRKLKSQDTGLRDAYRY